MIILPPPLIPSGGSTGPMPWQLAVWMISAALTFATLMSVLGLSMLSEAAHDALIYPGELGDRIVGSIMLWQFVVLPILLAIATGVGFLIRKAAGTKT